MPPSRKRKGGASGTENGPDGGKALHEEYDPQDFAFASRYTVEPVHKRNFPEKGMPARVVQQMIRDVRQLDSTPRLNLASFVTTWMEEECDKVMAEANNVNFIDAAEYPVTQELQERCVHMLGNLFNGTTEGGDCVKGTSTVGSSEAIILAGLAMKRRWRDERRSAGKETTSPNIVMGTETHVCWEKFTNYCDVEPRWVACREGQYRPAIEDLMNAIDENTIGLATILGTTYTGDYYDIPGIDSALSKVNADKGLNVKIHVDAASGGFVAPFLHPDFVWDFRAKNVVSINVSGHKYGLVYPGIGWVLFRSQEWLPDSLVFHDNYLGNDQITFTLNFSKGASQIIGQFYQFLRLGREGYTKVMENIWRSMMFLRDKISETNHFDLISGTDGLPVVTFSLKDKHRKNGFDEFDIADKLREHGWVVPAYTLAKNNEKIKVLRVVCREGFTMESVAMFCEHLHLSCAWLDKHFIYTEEQLKELKGFRKHSNHISAMRRRLMRSPANLGIC